MLGHYTIRIVPYIVLVVVVRSLSGCGPVHLWLAKHNVMRMCVYNSVNVQNLFPINFNLYMAIIISAH